MAAAAKRLSPLFPSTYDRFLPKLRAKRFPTFPLESYKLDPRIHLMNINDLDTLQSEVPAIFAQSAHESRSKRYKFVSTLDYVTALQERGWHISKAQQGRTRVGSRDHAKHFVTMRHNDFNMSRPELGSIVPQVYMLNSHDGTSRTNFLFGLFRLICTNGLVAASGEVYSQSFLHNASAKSAAEVLTDSFFANAGMMIETAEAWASITLDEAQTTELAVQARNIRFGEDSPVDPQSLLAARRPADQGNNLWLTFNRLQENITQGGIRFNGMRRMSRNVTNIGHTVDYNTRLWQAADNLALTVG
jgi:hypothetical protein